MLVSNTGFEPVTSSVSVISGTPDNATVAVSEVCGRTQTIAGVLDQLTSSLIGRTSSRCGPGSECPGRQRSLHVAGIRAAQFGDRDTTVPLATAGQSGAGGDACDRRLRWSGEWLLVKRTPLCKII